MYRRGVLCFAQGGCGRVLLSGRDVMCMQVSMDKSSSEVRSVVSVEGIGQLLL